MEIQEKTCVLIPTLNEIETIEMVIDGFYQNGFTNILVIDGGSVDGTREKAKEMGAEVIIQSGEGKGNAVREAFQMIESEIILMIDGDGTYLPKDGLDMVKPLANGKNHTIGDRFHDMSPDAMTLLNRVGNKLINTLFFKIYRENFKDVLSGYHAFNRDAIEDLFLTSGGFGIEVELGIRCASENISTEVVPISYRSRTGDSVAKLNPIRDGIVIVKTLYKLAQTSNPLFYFGSVGLIGLIIGGILSGYAIFDGLSQSKIHQVIIIGGVFFLLLGAQIMMLGLFSETILELHREKRNSIGKG